ncbi:MAG: WD40 repeat domain-containing protein [Planctomycetes bacterium]|nr:WD40 repeat domain-containing protein [Planctomycetota bacterium]MCC7396658.1 WD40 repeat domain-containing protein [Planctomycetota bacterium]
MPIRLPSTAALVAVTLFLFADALDAQCPPQPGAGFQLTYALLGAPHIDAMLEMPNGDIIAAGWFDSLGGVAASRIARWNGSIWSPLGGGVQSGTYSGAAHSLALANNGDLIVGGTFTSAGGVAVGNVARWDGTNWSAMGSIAINVTSMVCLANGDVVAGSANSNTIWLWHNGAWSTIGTINFSGGCTYSMAQDLNGDVLVTGLFDSVNGVFSRGIIRWSPTTGTWSTFGGYLTVGLGWLHDVAVMPNGELLTIGGSNQFGMIARWDGTAWSDFPDPPIFVDSTFDFTFPSKHMHLCADSQGRMLAVGLASAGSTSGYVVSEWDGVAWSSPIVVSSGHSTSPNPLQSSPNYLSAPLRASNGVLYVAGNFAAINSVANLCIARLDCPSATAGSYGDGCYHDFRLLHEDFANGTTFDLSQSTLRFTAVANGYQVDYLPGAPTLFSATSAPLAMADDSVTPAIALPFAFSYPGGSVWDICVGSNGIVWLGNSGLPNANYGASLAAAAFAALAPMWGDLDPSPTAGSGTVHYDVDASNQMVYVTWDHVQEYANPSLTSTFQVAIFANGNMEFRYQGCAASLPVVAGWTPGLSPLDHGAVDLTADGPFLCLDMSPPVLASTPPVLGTTVTFQATNLPATSLLGATMLGLTPIPSGLDLGFLGMPECRLFTTMDALDVAFLSSGTFTTQLVIPNVPTLTGVQIFAQGLVWATGFNASGMLVTNALDLHLGQ